jgi:SAM-dependent methyltransferase
MTILSNLAIALTRVGLTFLVVAAVLAAIHFPYDVDEPLTHQQMEAARKYYVEAYTKPTLEGQLPSSVDTEYVHIAEYSAKTYNIEELVRAFVKRFHLKDRPVLEIGSGRGYLQDLANDYTGLDISPAVARFYHKKFVGGTATALPFPDNSFDGVWSVWVFEHVPNPEQAFREARRVTRDGGVLFLLPAWNCTSWAAEGYEVRPYSDFGLGGKIIKASIPLRSSTPFILTTLLPNRLIRDLVGRFGPTRLRHKRLNPNYEKYWVADSDAVNSIDVHEAMLWFRSRGDECLNCGSTSILLPPMPLVVRVHKSTN